MLAALSNGAQTALIAAGASIATAVVTAVATTYSSRVRIREVRLTYDQRLHENYLASARAYTNAIYVPLSIAVTRLSAAYITFRDGVAADRNEPNTESVEAFVREIQNFASALADLIDQGGDAFLTTDLEDEVVSLRAFLDRSVSASAPVASVVLRADLGLAAAIPGIGSVSASLTREVAGPVARSVYRFPGLAFGVPGARAGYRVKKLLAAPLTSSEFERRMVQDLAVIKSRVKEVTLGAHSGPA
ncbi:MAG: hypothetical protein JWR37_253 [Mycobacterium sp.]|nr:hypothetical protein [Mycobacterium sp.]